MRKISADLLITNTGKPIPNGIIIFDESTGRISDILHSDADIKDVEKLNGVLIPGYINVHCHLELSHLKGVIPTGTGLIPFIKGVVGLRDFPQQDIDDAIFRADREMCDNGIVAVGDISNQKDTAPFKLQSEIRYYTFVELFDFLQDDQAQEVFDKHLGVYEAFEIGSKDAKSYVPHAAYSVSPSLFKLIQENNSVGQTVSIHNQELQAENDFFISRTGAFLKFFEDFGISVANFEAIEKSAIHYTFGQLQPVYNTLMVHNTKTSKEDIAFAHAWNPQTYWVTCPRANLYIENTLPRYELFTECDAKVCIGTDSLSSNWGLSIFEEMKTIKTFQSSTDDLEIIKWATYNGAQALGFSELGCLKKGSAPGINLIEVEVINGNFDLSKAKKSVKIN